MDYIFYMVQWVSSIYQWQSMLYIETYINITYNCMIDGLHPLTTLQYRYDSVSLV